MDFLENLSNLIEKKGETKTSLARNIGISESTIRAWYKGKQPTIDKLLNISEYFAISTDELLGITKYSLSDNEKELLLYFNKLSEREQIKCIARVEDLAEKFTQEEESSATKIG